MADEGLTQQCKVMLEIKQTKDTGDFETCALLMSQSAPWTILQRGYEKCMQSLEGDFKEVYTVTYNNQFAGFVVLQMVGSFKGYIQTICIKPEHRSKGLGSAVLAFCEERIFKVSRNVFMCVSSFNERAMQLYVKRGYEKVGDLKDFLIKGHSEFLLRKTID